MTFVPSYALARVTLVALLATTLSAGSVLAASNRTAAATKSKSGAMSDDVETRIKTLRSQLRITPEQEPAWNNVAQVMRDNANTMKSLREDKAENLATASAVEQITSYAKIVDAHADGIHKFVPAFQSLYDTLSPEQKKKADEVFRERAREGARRHTP